MSGSETLLSLEDVLARAREAGLDLSERTFRYYAVLGLLPRPTRRPSGAQDARIAWYPMSTVQRLLDIRALQGQGCSLKQIRRVLGGTDDAPATSSTPGSPRAEIRGEGSRDRRAGILAPAQGLEAASEPRELSCARLLRRLALASPRRGAPPADLVESLRGERVRLERVRGELGALQGACSATVASLVGVALDRVSVLEGVVLQACREAQASEPSTAQAHAREAAAAEGDLLDLHRAVVTLERIHARAGGGALPTGA